MNIYALMRRWWDWAYKNPSRVKPIHSALYFLMIDHNNRMGWKREFGFPTLMAMEAMGVSSFNTYKNALTDLIDFGFITMVERSRNQYSANIIALSYFDEAYDKAPDEAYDKALLKHATKHCCSTVQSTVSIDIQEYNLTNTTKDKQTYPDFEDAWIAYQRKGAKKTALREWLKVSKEERLLIAKSIPAYIASTEPRYRKDFERYISSGKYEGAVIESINTQPQKVVAPVPKDLWVPPADGRRTYD